MHKRPTFEVKIDSFSRKGNGLGIIQESEEICVEVPFTMPGDIAEVTLLQKSKDSFQAKLERIISPAPERIKAHCKHFTQCGGCRFQHLPYPLQLKQKENLVRNSFKDLIDSETQFHPIIESPQPWHYRNKSDYTFSSDVAGNKFLGLVIEASKGKVFNLSECHLTNPWFVNVVKAVKEWWDHSDLEAYHLFKFTGSLRSLTIREGQRTGDRMVILTVSGDPNYQLQTHHIDNFISCVRRAVGLLPTAAHLSIYLRIQTVGDGMPTHVYERCLYGQDLIREQMLLRLENETPIPLNLQIGPSSFFHHNIFHAENLYSLVVKFAKIPAGSNIYHLYSGIGTLSLFFARHAKEVIRIELSPEIAQQAQLNAKANGFQNTKVVSGAVRYILSGEFNQNLPFPDAILISPPRPGIDPKSLIAIGKIASPKIVYVSSNPITQANDIASLLHYGYRIETIQPADGFPMTAHVENIVVLKK